MDFSEAPSAGPPVTPELCDLADTPWSNKWESSILETQRGPRSMTPATIPVEPTRKVRRSHLHTRLVNLNGSILREVDLGQYQVRITDRDDAKGAIPWSRELPLWASLFVWHVYKHPITHSHRRGSVGNFAVIVTLVTLLSLLDGQLSGRHEIGHQLLSAVWLACRLRRSW